MSGLGQARKALGILAATLILLSALAHAFLGWPAMAAALADAGAGEDLAGVLLALFAFSRPR